MDKTLKSSISWRIGHVEISYLIKFIFSSLRIENGWLVAVIKQMAGSDKSIATCIQVRA